MEKPLSYLPNMAIVIDINNLTLTQFFKSKLKEINESFQVSKQI